MSNDKMREEFEAWALARFINSDTMKPLQRSADKPDGYHYPVLNTAWEAWRSSREALVIEPPEDFTAGGNPNARVLISHHREIVARWVRSIEAAGVKVKP